MINGNLAAVGLAVLRINKSFCSHYERNINVEIQGLNFNVAADQTLNLKH